MNYKNTIHAPLQELNTEHINHFYEKAFLNFFGLRNYTCIDIGNKIVKIASGEDYDALYGVFQKSSINLDYKIQFDHYILASLQEYINKSRIWFDKIIHIIESNLTNESNVAIYGVGQFAFKLLYEILNRRPDLNILLFDNNSLNEGKKISKFKINKGLDLDKYIANKKMKIVITSLIHQKSIKHDINRILSEQNIIHVEIIELN
jgi:FlaA1/EpsC-like NDP-sugar epimerase